MSMWRTLQRRLDRVVDSVFAEPVEMHPWREGSVTQDSSPDPARPVLRFTGEFVMPGASVTGEGGTMGAGLDTKIVENTVWISVTEDKLGDPTVWDKDDRVFLPERLEWFNIERIAPGATGRCNIYLIRIQEADV